MTDKYSGYDVWHLLIDAYRKTDDFYIESDYARPYQEAKMVAYLMSQAYEEGKKDEHKELLACESYPMCGHFLRLCKEDVLSYGQLKKDLEASRKISKNLYESLEEMKKNYMAVNEELCRVLEENEKLKEELENWKSSEESCDEQYELLLKQNQELKREFSYCKYDSNIIHECNIELAHDRDILKKENEALKEDLDKAKECIMLYRSYMEKSTSELKEFNSRFLGSNQHQSQ